MNNDETKIEKWKVLPHPLLSTRHRFHQARYVVTHDAVVEIYDSKPDVRNPNDWDQAWGLRNGVIICELGDSFSQEKYAKLIAAAPETAAERDRLKAALEKLQGDCINMYCALQSTAHMDPRDSRIAKITGEAIQDLASMAKDARLAITNGT